MNASLNPWINDSRLTAVGYPIPYPLSCINVFLIMVKLITYTVNEQRQVFVMTVKIKAAIFFATASRHDKKL